MDKQRLILAGEGLFLQTLVSCGRLTPLGEETLGKRLFTVREFDLAKSVVRIKPPAGTRAWRVRLETPDVPGTVDAMIEWCLDHCLDVVLFRRGIDEDERRRQEAAMAAKGQGHGRVAVLSDLDQPLKAMSQLEVDAIFYQEALHEDLCLALKRYAGHDETVVFSVASRGAEKRSNLPVVPVVAERATSPLVADHLLSVARLLRPWTPISSQYWGRLGLETSVLPVWPREYLRSSPWFDVDACRELNRQELWPYAYLGEVWEYGHTVQARELPDSTRGVYTLVNRVRFAAGCEVPTQEDARSFDPRRGRRAAWFDDEVELTDMGKTDLAHQHELRLLWGRRSIVVRTVRQRPDGAIRLLADVWHGNGVDRYLPILDLGWDVPEGWHATNFWGGSGDGLQWFELHGVQEMVPVTVRIVGHMSELGEVTSTSPVEFQYVARLSGLVIAPQPAADPGQAIGSAVVGAWRTDDEHGRFSPALTGGVELRAGAEIAWATVLCPGGRLRLAR